MGTTRENRVFLGNPGVGKSTLINCLVGANKVRAGTNYGGGLTQKYKRVVHGGIAYMDTPGLADETIEKEAAQAITKALRQGGVYKLFFLVRAESGRVVNEDLVTLERVLDSIDAGDLNYKFTIVMNCLSEREYTTLKAHGKEFKEIKTLINRKYRTESFCFIRRINELEDETDAVVELPRKLHAFLDDAPMITVQKFQVKPVRVGGFATHAEEIKKELGELRRNISELLRRMAEQEELYNQAKEQMWANHEEELSRVRKGSNVDVTTSSFPSPTMALSPSGDHPYTSPPPSPTVEVPPKRFSSRKKLVVVIVGVVVVIAIGVAVVAGMRSKSTPTPRVRKGITPIPSPDGKSQFLGCLTDEAMMSTDKAYGNAIKAYYSTALGQAEAKSKKYFALACRADYCHSFVFNKLLVNVTDFDGNDAGCKRLCPGSSAYYCGCSGGACEGTGVMPEGEISGRRWTVYERTSMNTTTTEANMNMLRIRRP